SAQGRGKRACSRRTSGWKVAKSISERSTSTSTGQTCPTSQTANTAAPTLPSASHETSISTRCGVTPPPPPASPSRAPAPLGPPPSRSAFAASGQTAGLPSAIPASLLPERCSQARYPPEVWALITAKEETRRWRGTQIDDKLSLAALAGKARQREKR